MADKFVLMEKDGERIEVHPLMVAEHERLKWKVVGKEEPADQAAIAETAPAAKPARGRGKKAKEELNG